MSTKWHPINRNNLVVLSNSELPLFLASVAMPMTSGSLLGFGVFCRWWQCRKRVVCVGHVCSLPCQPLHRWYGSYLLVGSRRRYVWWFEREGDGYDLMAPLSVENLPLSVGPLLITYLKRDRWKITWTDRCTNRGFMSVKGDFRGVTHGSPGKDTLPAQIRDVLGY